MFVNTEKKLIWQNGHFKKWDESSVHILSHTLHYGTGVFEGVRAYQTKDGAAIFRLNEHTNRLYDAAEKLNIVIPFSKKELNYAQCEILNANGLDDRSTLINMLIDFNSSNEVSTILDTININYENLIKFSNKKNDELFFVLFSILNENSDQKVQEDFTNIFDNRLTASLFITENIQNAIKNNDQNKLLIYSIVSINNLKWNEIHPSHLKLLLNGFLDYKNGDLIKDIILEIFEDYQLI